MLMFALRVLYRVVCSADRVTVPDGKDDVAVVHHPLVTGDVAARLELVEGKVVHFRVVMILPLNRMKLALIRPSTYKRNVIFICNLGKNLVGTPCHARDAVARLQFLDLLGQPFLDIPFPSRYPFWPVARYHYLHRDFSSWF